VLRKTGGAPRDRTIVVAVVAAVADDDDDSVFVSSYGFGWVKVQRARTRQIALTFAAPLGYLYFIT